MNSIEQRFVVTLLLLTLLSLSSAQVTSKLVYPGPEGYLDYVPDADHNRILDFSYAGYKNGEEPIPNVQTVLTRGPISGDNTAHLQSAIDQIGNMPMDANGIRGALKLEPGTYNIYGTLKIKKNGIVIRGSGNSTVLKAIGNSPYHRSIIFIGGLSNSDWNNEVSGTRTNILNEFLPAGSRSLKVQNPQSFNVGDKVVVFHPSTNAWLATINYGDTGSDPGWSQGYVNIHYKREIEAIDVAEGKIVLDVPIFEHFIRSLAQAQVFKIYEENILRNCGVENLKIDIQTGGQFDENHAWNGVSLEGVEDCWVDGVHVEKFGYAAVRLEYANRATVKNCKGLNPHAIITGSRRYNFVVDDYTSQILFENCEASEGRHSWVSNGRSNVSGIVFHNCRSTRDHTASEAHRHWSQGLLFDNITITNQTNTLVMGLYNRESYGSAHGWAAVHSVAWNVSAPSNAKIVVQKPPKRQNYLIGCKGRILGTHTFSHPMGYHEHDQQTVTPQSLFQAQRQDRLSRGKRPDAPARLSASYSNGQLRLDWDDIASTETGYKVYYSSNNGATFRELADLSADATSYSGVGSFGETGRLMYRVCAYNNSARSAYSTISEANVSESIPTWTANFESAGQGLPDQDEVFNSNRLSVDQQLDCEQLRFTVPDPQGNPLRTTDAITFNPRNSSGNDIQNLGPNPVVYLRARSKSSFPISIRLRSGDGSSAFQTGFVTKTIPAGLANWTVMEFSFGSGTMQGNAFNASDFKDLQILLDRGQLNFEGNELYLDYVSIGIQPEQNTWSDCTIEVGEPFVWITEFDSWSAPVPENIGVLEQGTLDLEISTICEYISLSVPEPDVAPMDADEMIIFNPKNSDGTDITNVSGSPTVYIRARSREEVPISVALRSSNGGTANRTNLVTRVIPANLDNWTLLEFPFPVSSYLGTAFDPTDYKDFVVFLDQGNENFDGNMVQFDFVSQGAPSPEVSWTDCGGTNNNGNIEPYVNYFRTIYFPFHYSIATNLSNFTYSAQCHTFQIEVADPEDNPLPPFNAYQIKPISPSGTQIKDITGAVSLSMRMKSAETISVDVEFLSGEGSASERSIRKSVTVPGGNEWNTFTINFADNELMGFDPADLRSVWFYLDYGQENFAGNKVLLDHILIGTTPNPELNSPCIDLLQEGPDLSNEEIDIAGSEQMRIFPNPSNGNITVYLEGAIVEEYSNQISVFDQTGKLLKTVMLDPYTRETPINLSDLPRGMYLLQLRNEELSLIERVIIQ